MLRRIRMLSVVSINDMPAVNKAGKTWIDQIDGACAVLRRGDAEQTDLPRSRVQTARPAGHLRSLRWKKRRNIRPSTRAWIT